MKNEKVELEELKVKIDKFLTFHYEPVTSLASEIASDALSLISELRELRKFPEKVQDILERHYGLRDTINRIEQALKELEKKP